MSVGTGRPLRGPPSWFSLLASALVFGLAYYAAAWLGAFLSIKPSHFEAFWPPSGLAVAVLLIAERRRWPAFLGAAFIASVLFNLQQANPLGVSLAYGLDNVLEPLVGALLVRRFVSPRPRLDSVREVVGLAFYSGFVSTGLSATIGASIFVSAFGGPFAIVWQAWWVANALGVLVIAPFILTWSDGWLADVRSLSRSRLVEGTALVLIIALLTALAFTEVSDWARGHVYLTLPPMIWAAVRFGPRGASMAGLVLTLVAVFVERDGAAPFGLLPPSGIPVAQSGLALQLFLIVSIFTVLLLGGVSAERRRSEREREALLTEVAALAGESQRTAAELRAVLDTMLDGVYVCDATGLLSIVNRAGLRLIGAQDLPGARMPLNQVVGALKMRRANDVPLAPQELALARALRGETVVGDSFVYPHPTTGQDLFVQASAAPIRDDAGRIVGAVAVARDVTELRELDRLKDQFVAVAAHELKTPVTIMKGYAQALLRVEPELPARDRAMLVAINRGSDRIDRLVRDLLDVSRLRALPTEVLREPVDLGALVREVTARMQTITDRHHLVARDVASVVVRGDPFRLEQVLSNLLDNAIRYSPRGGEVAVSVTVEDRSAVVAVADQGVGIPLDKQSRIFGQFFRAHTQTPSDYGGMGIGLYLSREIVRRHGGEMWFTSEEGKGSTFYFRLPVAEALPSP